MDEMFQVKDEITPEEFGELWTALTKRMDAGVQAALRGIANKARAKALDEALAVTMTAPYAQAAEVSARIKTLKRKSHY